MLFLAKISAFILLYLKQGGEKNSPPFHSEIMFLCANPSGQTVDEKRRAHCHDENYNDTDNQVLDHVTGIDLFFVSVCNGDFNTDVRTPDDDHRRKRDYNVSPRSGRGSRPVPLPAN